MVDVARPTLPERLGQTELSSRLQPIDDWWRAANYLSVGQIYLQDNPLLDRPLSIEHIKPRLLGHWGTSPGINFVWAHVNRLMVERLLPAIFVCGPGHGGPAVRANAWLEGTYNTIEPDVGWGAESLRSFFTSFSFPRGAPSHVGPSTPGSIHEGGELGYSLMHAHGAAFDAPGELVVCLIGDGEAETGPLAASWHSHRFMNRRTDGAVLPILHLNGYKIANPTVLARLPESELLMLFRGLGYEPIVIDCPVGETAPHRQMWAALDRSIEQLGYVEYPTRAVSSKLEAPQPLIILRTPKGWTGPDELDGQPVEGHFRSHQVPIDHDLGADRLVTELESWMRSYHHADVLTANGAPAERLGVLRPARGRRMSDNPRTNAGLVAKALELPSLTDHAVDLGSTSRASATRAAGRYLRDVMAANDHNFLVVGPDEVESNRLSALFEVTDRRWSMDRRDDDVSLGPAGRVFEILSEHVCQGWLEGYLLTGRHGLFTSYEAFIHIVDSMFNQHAKWLESASEVPWRRSIPSLNYLLSSHVWRQDHNGFSHQDPGFLDLVANKGPEIAQIFLPPDANSLLAVIEQCLGSTDTINVIVAGKQPEPQYLSLPAAVQHLHRGASIWRWAGTTEDGDTPDIVLACAGDVPTMEALAAAQLLDEYTELSVQVVNVVDLRVLQSNRHNARGLDTSTYGELFPSGVPVVFAFHGYPWLIHRLAYDRPNHDQLHVHGFREHGSTTTPFDMVVRNELDRFHLVLAALDHLPNELAASLGGLRSLCEESLEEHLDHVTDVGSDLELIQEWTYPSSEGGPTP